MSNPNHIKTANILPRGLRREQAAFYISISASKFDQGRKEGKIPAPRDFLGVRLYCRRDLDSMFDELPYIWANVAANDNNEWDSVLLGKGTLQ
jgi:hypothetical protein